MRAIERIESQQELSTLLKAVRESRNTDSERETVRQIMEGVRVGGDSHLLAECKRFAPSQTRLKVTLEELRTASIDTELASAIVKAAGNIRGFHTLLVPQPVRFSPVNGVTCERIPRGIQRVGLYVPGGATPLISSLLMQAIPAQLAGCSELVLCAGADNTGSINEALLWTANYLGISEVYSASGAAAIAAMAYGTETIAPVYKITGPGNEYVNQAKLSVQREGVCAIDLPAGPSELVLVVDAGARAEFIAADLISQAEHGGDSFTAVVSKDADTLQTIISALKKQVGLRNRCEILQRSIQLTRFLQVFENELIIQTVNEIAPEHVTLIGAEAESLVPYILSAGSLFVGEYTPESLGDYLSGMNHILPTKGCAKSYSGCSVETYTKWIGVQRSTQAGLEQLSKSIQTLALAEGLDGHAYAAEVRGSPKYMQETVRVGNN